MSGYLVEFERNQRGRDNHREVFGPPFSHQETDSLGQQQSRVKKRANAELLQLLGTRGEGFYENAMDEAIVRIDPERFDPMGHRRRYILVYELQSPDAHGD